MPSLVSKLQVYLGLCHEIYRSTNISPHSDKLSSVGRRSDGSGTDAGTIGTFASRICIGTTRLSTGADCVTRCSSGGASVSGVSSRRIVVVGQPACWKSKALPVCLLLPRGSNLEVVRAMSAAQQARIVGPCPCFSPPPEGASIWLRLRHGYGGPDIGG
jgi:hypothetical protein